MLPAKECNWREWHVPLQFGHHPLRAVLDSYKHLSAKQSDIPLIIRLIENPKFSIPGLPLFNGAVDLHDHDCIHALLGRGLLPKDEAFTIGFTMGSTHRVTTAETRLYAFAAKHLYPGPYKFDSQAIQVFKDAVHLGYVSDCIPLNQVKYRCYYDLSLDQARAKIGIEADLLAAYFRIEQRRYPDSVESQRLIVRNKKTPTQTGQ